MTDNKTKQTNKSQPKRKINKNQMQNFLHNKQTNINKIKNSSQSQKTKSQKSNKIQIKKIWSKYQTSKIIITREKKTKQNTKIHVVTSLKQNKLIKW